MTQTKHTIEIEEADLETISEQVKEGYIEGHLSDGEGNRIYWTITINKWKD